MLRIGVCGIPEKIKAPVRGLDFLEAPVADLLCPQEAPDTFLQRLPAVKASALPVEAANWLSPGELKTAGPYDGRQAPHGARRFVARRVSGGYDGAILPPPEPQRGDTSTSQRLQPSPSFAVAHVEASATPARGPGPGIPGLRSSLRDSLHPGLPSIAPLGLGVYRVKARPSCQGSGPLARRAIRRSWGAGGGSVRCLSKLVNG